MLEGFFSRKKKKSGGHGSHWDAAVWEDNKERPELKDIVMESAAKGKLVDTIDFVGGGFRGKLSVLKKEFGGLVVTTYVLDGPIGTSFPSIESDIFYSAKIKEVEEWANEAEAQVTANFFDASLSFFATDYPINEKKYQKGNNLKINISALAYKLREGSLAGKDKFAEDFTSILPANIAFKDAGFDVDDYHVNGFVESLKKTSFAGHETYIVKAKVTKMGKVDFLIDIGVLKRNIEGAVPKKGDKITATIWLTGGISGE